MIPFHNALSIAPGEAVKTKAEFDAYIAGLAPSTTNWSGSVSNTSGLVRIMTQDSLPSYMPLVGSPWGPLTPDGVSGSYSYWAGVVWHSMPDKETFDAIRAGSGQVLMTVEDGGISSPSYGSYSRNSLQSTASAAASTYVRRVAQMLYYLPGVGPMKIQPKLGLGPVPFSW